MFNLFSSVSNEDISAVVRRALDHYMSDHDLAAAVIALTRFADRHRLSDWRRTRFAAEVSMYALRRGMCQRAALAFGDGFGAFVDRRVTPDSMHWKAYTAGMEGAVRHCEGWTEAACREVGARLVEDYLLSPADRANLLRSYELGWSLCEDASVTSDAVATLLRACNALTEPDTTLDADAAAAMHVTGRHRIVPLVDRI